MEKKFSSAFAKVLIDPTKLKQNWVFSGGKLQFTGFNKKIFTPEFVEGINNHEELLKYFSLCKKQEHFQALITKVRNYLQNGSEQPDRIMQTEKDLYRSCECLVKSEWGKLDSPCHICEYFQNHPNEENVCVTDVTGYSSRRNVIFFRDHDGEHMHNGTGSRHAHVRRGEKRFYYNSIIQERVPFYIDDYVNVMVRNAQMLFGASKMGNSLPKSPSQFGFSDMMVKRIYTELPFYVRSKKLINILMFLIVCHYSTVNDSAFLPVVKSIREEYFKKPRLQVKRSIYNFFLNDDNAFLIYCYPEIHKMLYALCTCGNISKADQMKKVPVSAIHMPGFSRRISSSNAYQMEWLPDEIQEAIELQTSDVIQRKKFRPRRRRRRVIEM
jgi:hypothetical protein